MILTSLSLSANSPTEAPYFLTTQTRNPIVDMAEKVSGVITYISLESKYKIRPVPSTQGPKRKKKLFYDRYAMSKRVRLRDTSAFNQLKVKVFFPTLFFFKIVLAILSCSHFHINFRISSSIYLLKKVCQDFG